MPTKPSPRRPLRRRVRKDRTKRRAVTAACAKSKSNRLAETLQKRLNRATRHKAKRPKHICYDHPPRTKAARGRRRNEQRGRAAMRGRDWSALSRGGRLRRIRFGSKAVCRNVRDVVDLTTINAGIAHDREQRAVRSWRLDADQAARLERCIGFAPSNMLIASNKRVRVELGSRLARLLTRLFRRGNRHFYWVTLIHDGWHSGHNATTIDLGDIRWRVRRAMRGAGLEWLGMIEIDIFNNWKAVGGLRISPHVHLVAWSRDRIGCQTIKRTVRKKLLRSELGAPVVVIKNIRTVSDLAHLGYYMAKPNHIVKSLGILDTETGRRRVYSPDEGVRPGHTLRVAEILSYMEIRDVLMGHGEGCRVRTRLLRGLRRSEAISTRADDAVGDVREMWRSFMPVSRLSRAGVCINRGR